MLNNKYGKLLTVILIIAIIVIIGLLVFIGVDWYKAYTTVAEQDNMMEQFNGYINNVQEQENSVNNELNAINNAENTNPIIPNIDQNNIDQNNQTNSGGNTSSQKPTYKGFTIIGSIRIPKTGLESVILEESSPKAMEAAICRMYGPEINEIGNVVLIGHNFKNGTLFSDNKKLAVGDKIYLKDLNGKEVEYTISKKYTTTVEDFDYSVRDTKGKRGISLSTCTDDTKSRLILWAEES